MSSSPSPLMSATSNCVPDAPLSKEAPAILDQIRCHLVPPPPSCRGPGVGHRLSRIRPQRPGTPGRCLRLRMRPCPARPFHRRVAAARLPGPPGQAFPPRRLSVRTDQLAVGEGGGPVARVGCSHLGERQATFHDSGAPRRSAANVRQALMSANSNPGRRCNNSSGVAPAPRSRSTSATRTGRPRIDGPPQASAGSLMRSAHEVVVAGRWPDDVMWAP
jgi:hypothetical protein